MTSLRRHAHWLAAVAVPAAAIVAYFNAFSGTFQFDDRPTVLDDSRLRSLGAFVDHLPAMIRPLTRLTYLIDRTLFGGEPGGYHLLNVLLHAGSALLVFGILRVALGGAGLRPADRQAGCLPRPDGLQWLPLCAALLFAVHPLAADTVTYISGRPTGLASFFTLLSVYLGARATTESSSRWRFAVTTAGTALCFVLGLLSKETAVVAPALLLLVQLTAGVRGRDEVKRLAVLQATLWVFAIAFASTAPLHPRYAVLITASFETRSVWTNLLTEANAVFYALSLFAAPSRLCFDHDLPVVASVLQWPAPVALGVLAMLATVAAGSIRRAPTVSLGLGWFFIALLPAHSVIPRFDILSERNLYLPAVGIFIVVGTAVSWLGARAAGRWPRGGLAAASLFLCVLAWLGTASVARNRVYASEVALWQDAVAKSPRKSRPHQNLGYALRMTGDIDGAIQEFRTALALDPANLLARRNLLEAWDAQKSRHGRTAVGTGR